MWAIAVPPISHIDSIFFNSKKQANEFLKTKRKEEKASIKDKSDWWYARPGCKIVKVFIEYNRPFSNYEEEVFEKWWNKHYTPDKV